MGGINPQQGLEFIENTNQAKRAGFNPVDAIRSLVAALGENAQQAGIRDQALQQTITQDPQGINAIRGQIQGTPPVGTGVSSFTGAAGPQQQILEQSAGQGLPDYAKQFKDLAQGEKFLAEQTLAGQQQGLLEQQRQLEAESQQQQKMQALQEQLTQKANDGTVVDNTDLVQNLIQGFRENISPYQTRNGVEQTSPFFDILRAAAANYAPAQSKIFEEEVKSRLAQVKASKELLLKFAEGNIKTRKDLDKAKLTADNRAEDLVFKVDKLADSRVDTVTKSTNFKDSQTAIDDARLVRRILQDNDETGIAAVKRLLVTMAKDKRISQTDFETSAEPVALANKILNIGTKKFFGKLSEPLKRDIDRLVTKFEEVNSSTINGLLDRGFETASQSRAFSQDQESLDVLKAKFDAQRIEVNEALADGGVQVGRFIVREK